jgi:glycosyltransferase involved in cell wall biosynthesis
MTGKNQINYNPTDNTWYLGHTPYSRIQSVYKKAGVLLLPSLYEGFSNIILEAYSMGRPVIGNDNSIPNEIPVFGFKIPNDISNWINALACLKDSDYRYDLGIKARLYATRNFRWDQYSHKMKIEFEKAYNDYKKNH